MEEEREQQPEQENSSNKANLISAALGLATKFWSTKAKIIIVLIFFATLFFGLILLLLFGSIIFFFNEDGSSDGNSLSFSQVGDDSGFWWPVGSNETTTKNGVTFASGTPALTAISSNFTSNRCLGGTCRAHKGFDIGSGGKIGVYNLIAIKSGTVVKAYNECEDNGTLNNSCGGQLGNYVTIDHGNGYYSRYQHMAKDSVTVKVGDTVQQGQVIGKIGKSGRCTGAHLHFEIQVGGSTSAYAVDPLTYVDPDNPRPVSSSSSFVEGTENVQTVCLTLKASGLPDDAVAGIMGNIYHESRFDPNAINEIDCHGLVQWCYGRKDDLLRTYGSNWNKIENQLSKIVQEINSNSYASTKKALLSNITVEEKAYKFCMLYEIPDKSICASGARQSQARSYYNYVKNGCK